MSGVDMAQSRVQDQIRGHDARNASLLAHLQELGARLDVARPIDCFFWAPNPKCAEDLRVLLVGRGLVNVLSSPPVDDDAVWSVQGQVNVRPDLMGSRGMTEQLVELGASCGAEYDGWGTRVPEAKANASSGGSGGPTSG
jgi:hypothetical protein